ncbi:NirD/YgiW/YdeI family stress tolerance protein [Endozoicomonas sp. GU-1]|uniref:NirD/YgiW/YdeI family stress tolerance protein n=1 Tax=Endozoicomonas sp. GU-1 TaxID=3009078 RepID=UPI0022B550F1|nr:NirD/YgiW/YdeI family stress tolerance protein [Endozoicomonas sp. GU-1]WBA81147.1 NirD/YgiW/YdeI family stress tolerance protein [Endozoicomonas sp. GU-1]WBA88713.1 NirD/YgiW/YdeI family stress tolerance protein [Endozoicomonas sp. GU-1]
MKLYDVYVQKLVRWSSAVLLAFTVFVAEGAYIGPGSGVSSIPDSGDGTTTVAAILKNPQDDRRVVLRGNLVRKVKHETYLFNDGTGEIIADIDDNDFPPQPITANTTVEIIGEVDVDRVSAVEIDVKSLRIISK